MKELERYYKVLGLDHGASLDEINQAYKDLVFIWHPDRIPKDNQRLLEKATAKLQEINHAREQLRQIHQNSSKSSNYAPKPEKKPAHAYKTASPYQPHPSQPGQNSQTHSHKTPSQETHSQHSHSQNNHQVHNHAAWRPHYRDLNGADLQGANLKEKDLSNRSLIGADLSHAQN